MKSFRRLEQHTWNSARKSVHAVYPRLAQVIDEISPDDKFTLYTASYPYGAMIIDKGVFFVPNSDGNVVPLYHPTIPQKHKEDLDFKGTIPVGLVMKNKIESFMEHGERITPFTLFSPGDLLALWRIFDKTTSYQEAPFWRVCSGSRAICMLPKITDKNGYAFFKKKYNLSTPIPKNLRDHWYIFSHIANHPEFDEPWSSEIIYFSKTWFSTKNDSAWSSFHHLLLNKVWQESAFNRNKMMFDYFFSVIQEQRNLKPNPYLADTVAHLMAICSGEVAGFTPARDNTAAPISGLQRTFLGDYRLKKYPPVIMHTHHFSVDKEISVYYSFEMPTTMQFSPRSNNALTTIAEIRGMKHIADVLFKEIKAGNIGIEKTPLFDLAQKLRINFYHNERDHMNEILPANHLSTLDKSLVTTLIDNEQYTFPESSPFFKGCIAISAS